MHINNIIENDTNNTNGINWLIDYTGEYIPICKQLDCNIIPVDALHNNYINPFDICIDTNITDTNIINRIIEQKIDFIYNVLRELLGPIEFQKNIINHICQKLYNDYIYYKKVPTMQTFYEHIKEIPSVACQTFTLGLEIFCNNSYYDMFAHQTNIKVSKDSVNVFDLQQMPDIIKSATAMIIQEYTQNYK